MKVFRIDIDVTSLTYETVYAYVDAETEDEALALFNENPYDYDWGDWETHDSEIQDWTVDQVVYDEWMTNRMSEDTDA